MTVTLPYVIPFAVLTAPVVGICCLSCMDPFSQIREEKTLDNAYSLCYNIKAAYCGWHCYAVKPGNRTCE